MRKRWSKRRREIGRALIIASIILSVLGMPALSKAEGALQLEVLLNGKPTGLIGAFLQNAKGELSAQRKELEALHLKVPEQFAPEDEVPLAALAGVSWRYDEAKQSLDIAVADVGLLPQTYDLRGAANPLPVTPPATGAVLNYLLFGGSGGKNIIANWQFQGASATLDGRIFSPYGTLSQTGILNTNSGNSVISDQLRLDTAWTYKDPDRALTYRAGDMISGGLLWTRPVRRHSSATRFFHPPGSRHPSLAEL
jgi:outer membrane usher protein